MPGSALATIPWHLLHSIMPIMHSIPAIFSGICIGLLGTAGMQKYLINPQAINTCNKPGISDTHRLVTLTSVVGDTKYCIHTRYLAN
jgi:hypothetical protein